ncbi:O-antigen ligase family protein [Streptomyces carminius]|uniref:O-antigen ligase family protein n=1 Tax=Streptomyces carminius TaxID=2665496 RepID=UPI001E371502|nr:O-antigen ligase family protein [Streptomyces carminius]
MYGRTRDGLRDERREGRPDRWGSTPAGAPGRLRAAAAAHWPVLPVLATVALVCVPAGTGPAPAPGTAGTGATAADAASGLLVLCCALSALRTRSRPLDRTAVVVLAVPAAAFALSAVTARDPVAALPGLVRLLQVFVLVPAALVLVLRSRRCARLVLAALVAVALVQGAVGVHQYLTGTGASYQGENIRAVGTFGPLDVMGMSSAVSCGVVAALALGLAPPPGTSRRLRTAALASSAVLLVPLALSFSRGAWLSTAVAGTAVLFLAGTRTALRTLAALLLVVLLAVSPAAGALLADGTGTGGGQLARRAGSITEVADAPDSSVTDRYTLWAASVAMWRADPVTGVGPRGFAGHRDTHASLALSSASDTAGAGQDFHRQPLLSPHNMYLLVLAEQGLAGATAVLGGWAALLVLGVRRLRRARAVGPGPGGGPGGDRGTDCGLAAVGLLVLHLTDFLYADIGGPSTVLTAVAFGLAAWWALAPGRATRAVRGGGEPAGTGADAR